MTRVVLITKQRPEYLKGQLVGVGGKLEPGETPAEVISREFWEEAGVRRDDWEYILTYNGDLEQVINVFMAIGDLTAVYTNTDEEVVVVDVFNLPKNTNRTTRWTIPMCLDHHIHTRQRRVRFLEVKHGKGHHSNKREEGEREGHVCRHAGSANP